MPFLVILTLIDATPLPLVFALKVFLLTLIVTVLPLKAVFPDFKVILTVLTFLTFKVTLLAVNVVAFLTGVGVGGTGLAFTVIFALPNDALYSSSPANENVA